MLLLRCLLLRSGLRLVLVLRRLYLPSGLRLSRLALRRLVLLLRRRVCLSRLVLRLLQESMVS
jgi:hypothetical protein